MLKPRTMNGLHGWFLCLWWPMLLSSLWSCTSTTAPKTIPIWTRLAWPSFLAGFLSSLSMITLSLVPLLLREFSLLCCPPSLGFYLFSVLFCLPFEVGWIWFFGWGSFLLIRIVGLVGFFWRCCGFLWWLLVWDFWELVVVYAEISCFWFGLCLFLDCESFYLRLDVWNYKFGGWDLICMVEFWIHYQFSMSAFSLVIWF